MSLVLCIKPTCYKTRVIVGHVWFWVDIHEVDLKDIEARNFKNDIVVGLQQDIQEYIQKCMQSYTLLHSTVSLFEKTQICFEFVPSRCIFWTKFWRRLKKFIITYYLFWYFLGFHRGTSLLFAVFIVQKRVKVFLSIGDMPSSHRPHWKWKSRWISTILSLSKTHLFVVGVNLRTKHEQRACLQLCSVDEGCASVCEWLWGLCWFVILFLQRYFYVCVT